MEYSHENMMKVLTSYGKIKVNSDSCSISGVDFVYVSKPKNIAGNLPGAELLNRPALNGLFEYVYMLMHDVVSRIEEERKHGG